MGKFGTSSPLSWVTPRIKMSQAWVSNVRTKGMYPLTDKQKEIMAKAESDWEALSEVERKDFILLCQIKKLYNRLSKKGKWEFKKEVE